MDKGISSTFFFICMFVPNPESFFLPPTMTLIIPNDVRPGLTFAKIRRYRNLIDLIRANITVSLN